MPALQLQQIRKQFGATVALDGVNLTLEPGQVHALVGENGAGKSTLVKILAGEVAPDSGRIRRGDDPYQPASPVDAALAGVVLIHQEPALCPHLSVQENLSLGREPARMGWVDLAQEQRRAERALALFDHPELKPERILGQLPISARQIVDICRVLQQPSEVILMDEPSSALQAQDVRRLFELIRELVGADKSILYISHFLEEVREIAETVTVLRDGRDVLTGSIAEIDDEQLITAMVGRPVENLFPGRTSPEPSTQPLLQLRHLHHPPAVGTAAFELFPGEVLGIAGLAGSGRTAMIRALFGLERPANGWMVLGGREYDLTRAEPDRRITSGLGYLSEDRAGEGLALSLSLADNLTLTRMRDMAWAGWLDLKRELRVARDWMGQLRIRARSPLQPAQTLSGGNQQKVCLGRLLCQDAQVLLLDEPTRGVDIGSKVEIYRAITDQTAKGKAVLLVSSYLPELFGLCHRLAVMSRGRLGQALPIQSWTPESVLAEALGRGENGQ